jgi:hypothetical protein
MLWGFGGEKGIYDAVLSFSFLDLKHEAPNGNLVYGLPWYCCLSFYFDSKIRLVSCAVLEHFLSTL